MTTETIDSKAEDSQIDQLIERFMSNPKLRKADQKIPMTAKRVQEFAHCKDDPIYFIERYVKIVNVDHGLVNMKLYPKQKEMVQLAHNNRKVIIKAARQVGKTTTLAVGYLLHYAIFNKSKFIAILANKEKTANEILARLKIAYMNLPLWLQQGVLEWSATKITLENGSAVASSSTSSSAIRGFSINLLYLDEFAHVPPNIADEFFASVYPTISSGQTTKVIITSTPNGMNLFYKLATDAINKRSDFVIGEYDWRVVPWRDQKWADDQKQALGEDKFEQEYLCEFLGSAGTLISGKFLRSMAFINALEELLEHKLFVYERAKPGRMYMLCADSSHGKELDYSAFCVMDISEAPYRIVAKYRNNDISAQLYPNVIASVAKHYNNAWVLAENNDIGAQVLQILVSDLEYENIIYTTDKTRTKEKVITNQLGQTAGVRTTPKTKRQGCNALKTLIEAHQLIIEDFHIIEELSTFIAHKNKQYSADEGKNDDLVMCLVIFAWATTQQFFKDLTDLDMRKRMFEEQRKAIEEAMPPMPVMPGDPMLKPNQVKENGVIWEIVGQETESDIDPKSGHSFHGRWGGW